MLKRPPNEIAAVLAWVYGPDPSKVGPDGNEDEFGDLCWDAYADLTGKKEPDENWEHFLDVASASRATTMDAWIAELAAVISIYGKDPDEVASL